MTKIKINFKKSTTTVDKLILKFIVGPPYPQMWNPQIMEG